MVKIGIIGGSGLDDPTILHDGRDRDVTTPYGKPSSPLKVGTIKGIPVVLIARHGREHTIPPTFVNNRANIQALQQEGCTHILATTACGSLREVIKRGDLVILDQFIDFTRLRKLSFHDTFEPHHAVHTGMAEPFHKDLRQELIRSCQDLGLSHHQKGTVITIEGPRFSTKAESKMFRSWGADVINMSIAPECILANEAGIPYAAIAMSTDYDCWKEDEDAVSWEEILKTFQQNVSKVISLLTTTIPRLADQVDLRSIIRTVPHWPKPGIMFRDITPVLQNPEAFAFCIQKFKGYCQGKNITKIAGIESRGFIFGAALAKELSLPLILVRKKGKLPAEKVSVEYQLEYGTDILEMHKDAVASTDQILIVDDLIATGGTLQAAIKLIESIGGKVAGCAVVIELPALHGRDTVKGYEMISLIQFEGD